MNLNSKLLNILGVDRHFSTVHLEFRVVVLYMHGRGIHVSPPILFCKYKHLSPKMGSNNFLMPQEFLLIFLLNSLREALGCFKATLPSSLIFG